MPCLPASAPIEQYQPSFLASSAISQSTPASKSLFTPFIARVYSKDPFPSYIIAAQPICTLPLPPRTGPTSTGCLSDGHDCQLSDYPSK
ncbi:hypothetical protein BJY04DRAFT_178211 [Aspergillus karnatakaensis]|uniref:uncharacterized protein n=1 Tax=Aspergillus karnatakaensis TaxID=1810916 RepID=UPI003CCD9DF0